MACKDNEHDFYPLQEGIARSKVRNWFLIFADTAEAEFPVYSTICRKCGKRAWLKWGDMEIES